MKREVLKTTKTEVRTTITITREDILALVASKGVELPSNVSVEVNDNEMYECDALIVSWTDTTYTTG